MKALVILLCLVATLSQARVLDQIDDPVSIYLALSAADPGACAGRRLLLPVDSEGIELAPVGSDGTRQVLYRTDFNQVTEGWNWHPESVREGDDYYHAKFLSLASVSEARGSYRSEDKIGEPQEFQVLWRYDYFASFENLYELIERHRFDDDAGFTAAIPADTPAERIGLAALLILKPPCTAESTTFWKATHAKPVDFTLKKRYLTGDLTAMVFYDRSTRRVLAINGRLDQ